MSPSTPLAVRKGVLSAPVALALMPGVFVLLWSTGFIVARYAMPHAPPFSFLAMRFALSVLCFGVWLTVARVRLPRSARQWGHLAVTGVLMHGVYLGGVWSAVKAGMGAGTTALIVGLQPLLTAVWLSQMAHVPGQPTVTRRQWVGLVSGFVGMGLVVKDKLGIGEINPVNLAMVLAALAGITMGTLYQKRFVAPCDVRAASFIQLLAAGGVTAPWCWMETEVIDWHPHMLGALAWSVLALTLGASSMLYLMIQRGAATRVTSLLYLVPPCTALMAWLLFDEALTVWTLAGVMLTVSGVALVTRVRK